MALGTDYARQDCSLARALELVGERWTLLILRDAFFGVRRFSDFEVHLDISKAVLAQRLAALVEVGLLARTEDAGTPPVRRDRGRPQPCGRRSSPSPSGARSSAPPRDLDACSSTTGAAAPYAVPGSARPAA